MHLIKSDLPSFREYAKQDTRRFDIQNTWHLNGFQILQNFSPGPLTLPLPHICSNNLELWGCSFCATYPQVTIWVWYLSPKMAIQNLEQSHHCQWASTGCSGKCICSLPPAGSFTARRKMLVPQNSPGKWSWNWLKEITPKALLLHSFEDRSQFAFLHPGGPQMS